MGRGVGGLYSLPMQTLVMHACTFQVVPAAAAGKFPASRNGGHFFPPGHERRLLMQPGQDRDGDHHNQDGDGDGNRK